MTCGIYKITSPSGRIYIGQSRNIERRWSTYYNNDCKGQIKLKHSFEKYGAKAHTFEIIEECKFEKLNIRERYWQEFYNSMIDGLNCYLTNTEEKPKVLSAETRQKISLSRLGQKPSKESCLKMSISSTGKKHSEETKLKMSSFHSGKKVSEETKLKMSIACTGEKNHMFGKIVSQETRQKISLAQLNRKVPEKIKRKLIDTLTNKIYSSIKEAAEDMNLNYGTLRNMLSMHIRNTTSLIYYNESKSQKP